MQKNNPFIPSLFIIGAVIVVGYSLFTARFFIAGPSLTINNPSYIESESPLITISGTTSHVQALWINGHEVFLESGGAFTDTRTLTPGISYIHIYAKDRFDRSEERIITAYYNPPHVVAPEAFMTEEEAAEVALEEALINAARVGGGENADGVSTEENASTENTTEDSPSPPNGDATNL